MKRTRVRTRTAAEKAARTRRLKSKDRALRSVSKLLTGVTVEPAMRKQIEKSIGTAADRAARESCVTTVLNRDVSCRCGCGKPIAHVHEEPPRSHGGDPTNPNHCIGLSLEDHHDRHFGIGARKLRIEYLDGTSFGRVLFTRGTGSSARSWYTIPMQNVGPIVVRQRRCWPDKESGDARLSD